MLLVCIGLIVFDHSCHLCDRLIHISFITQENYKLTRFEHKNTGTTWEACHMKVRDIHGSLQLVFLSTTRLTQNISEAFIGLSQLS